MKILALIELLLMHCGVEAIGDSPEYPKQERAWRHLVAHLSDLSQRGELRGSNAAGVTDFTRTRDGYCASEECPRFCEKVTMFRDRCPICAGPCQAIETKLANNLLRFERGYYDAENRAAAVRLGRVSA